MSREVAEFCADPEPRCLELRSELSAGAYTPGAYHTFLLLDPKPRLISAAPFRDRVVHHSLSAVIEPQLERHAIHDSYACRVNRGLHRAVERAERFTRRYSAYLKLDVHHYFETIHHETLKAQLRARFKDDRLLALCDQIIDHGAPGSSVGRGLPIGNLTSQHFANFYLSYLDRFIKQTLRVKGYLRYMDDLLLFADDFETLRGWRAEVQSFVSSELQLSLKPRAERLDWVRSGVPFLGLRIAPHATRFDQGRKRRLRARLHHLNQLHAHEIDEPTIASASSLYAWARLADSEGLIRSWIERWGLQDS